MRCGPQAGFYATEFPLQAAPEGHAPADVDEAA